MICRCCNRDVKLCEAHIVPKHVSRLIKAGEQRGVVYNSRSDRMVYNQGGFWDDTILCTDCDNGILGKWDDYAARFFRNEHKWREIAQSDWDGAMSYYEYDNFRYADLKLYFISILWRMSITRHEHFENVSLGKYELQAREMIINRDPGDENHFSVLLVKLKNPRMVEDQKLADAYRKGVILPAFYRENGGFQNHYRYACYGFDIIIKTDQRPFGEPYNHFCLSPNRIFRVLEQDYEGSWPHKAMKAASDPYRQAQSALIK